MGSAVIPARWAVEQDQRELVLTELFTVHGVESRASGVLPHRRARAGRGGGAGGLPLPVPHWQTVRKESSALAYLRAAVINRCRSDQRRLIRARTRDPLVAVSQTVTVPSSEASVIAHDESSRIFTECASSQRQRVIVCRYYLDLGARDGGAARYRARVRQTPCAPGPWTSPVTTGGDQMNTIERRVADALHEHVDELPITTRISASSSESCTGELEAESTQHRRDKAWTVGLAAAVSPSSSPLGWQRVPRRPGQALQVRLSSGPDLAGIWRVDSGDVAERLWFVSAARKLAFLGSPGSSCRASCQPLLCPSAWSQARRSPPSGPDRLYSLAARPRRRGSPLRHSTRAQRSVAGGARPLWN